MLAETARLLYKHLKYESRKYVLNVGSGTHEHWMEKEPWIWKFVLKPLRDNECLIINMDLKEETGAGIPYAGPGKGTIQHVVEDITKQTRYNQFMFDVILSTEMELGKDMALEFRRLIDPHGALWVEMEGGKLGVENKLGPAWSVVEYEHVGEERVLVKAVPKGLPI